jgi:hypothetical protein|nr:MAG TPA: hypothetical protein [Caudoviricetes sp.]
MAYLDEVYFKRINKYGFNIQERIQNKKNHDFNIVLKKSPNKVTIFKDSEIFYGILQNKTNNEKEVIDYLLTNKFCKWNDGTVLITENVSNQQQKKWLIFHLDDFVSIGYNRYQVTELDREIELIDDGIIYKENAHIVGSGAKSITSKFSINYDVSVFYEPNKVINLIMRTNPKLKKGLKLIIQDEAWRISGIDKISVPGVSYITLEEDYISEEDLSKSKDTIAEWSIQSTEGENISLMTGDSKKIGFFFYYNDIKREDPYRVKIKDRNIVKYSNDEMTSLSRGKTYCEVSLIENPLVKKIFPIEVSDVKINNFIIVGPEKIRIEEIIKFNIFNNKKTISFRSENQNFKIESIQNNILKIKGLKIGKDKLIAEEDSKIIFEKPIEVESLWMGG